ncbi:MAG TPA: A/G-specific adenine glycosylase [Phycisphaerae bacterium]|nr:A/G-specific adenine glycosylase [Phycisphaerae bacterium]
MPRPTGRSADARAIQSALEAWWHTARRDLPWRRRSDPYAIWVSEVMLQQTRVATASGYYRRFLEAFPTVGALARADLSRVLKCWEGLGYYARARHMHAAARRVVEQFGGELPASVEALRSLPGVGAYTAAAVASIAFGLDEPVLDGNVTRVLCRLFRVRQDPKLARTRKRLTERARSLIPPGKAGLINQAIMDLGATVCVPGKPRCLVCPLRKHCLARARGEQHRLPRKAARKPTPHYDVAAGIVWRRGRVLIDRRKPEGLLGGLWEFPGGKRRAGETLDEAVVREVREEVGIEVRPTGLLATVRHAYSHFRITLHAFECVHVSGRARAIGCDAVKWVRPDELEQYAFPKANQKVLAALHERLADTSPTRKGR